MTTDRAATAVSGHPGGTSPSDEGGPALVDGRARRAGDVRGVAGRWQTVMPDGRVRCDLCPRGCTMREGQRGFCFVRERHGADIWCTTWGRASGFALDPVEKKPLVHFHPGSAVLSFGTAGCNLACRFCQNHQISAARKWDRLGEEATPAQIAGAARRLGAAQVAMTYNDPVIFAEYAIDTARACHEVGVRSIAVTAGWITPRARADFFDVMDATNIDLKGFDADFYRKVTGAELSDVLDTISWVANRGRTWVELTTLLIPGYNDSEEEVRAECRWILSELGPDVPLHFSAFHPDHRMRDVPPTEASTLRRVREVALTEGLHFVYCGNVHDVEADTTRCAGCGQVLIRRDWYRILDYRLDPRGCCPSCGTVLPGRFGAGAGGFGPHSVPVHI